MSERQRCPRCVEKGLPKPLFAAFPDGRCFNHSQSQEAVARRKEAGAKGGPAGRSEAKERKAKRIAGPTKGAGLAAADVPAPPPPPTTPADALPSIDFSSADAVTASMAATVSALFRTCGVNPDSVKAAEGYFATAQKVRAPKGVGGDAPKKAPRKVIEFRPVAPVH